MQRVNQADRSQQLVDLSKATICEVNGLEEYQD